MLPAAGASRPGTAASTPGSSRPPRTPGTPGVWAKQAEAFEVMESPAVRAALAGRPQQPGTAASSPAGSMASPGYVSTLPVSVLADHVTKGSVLGVIHLRQL